MLLPAVGLGHSVQVKELGCARVALPVKVLLGVAVAAQIETLLLTSRAVSKGHVEVCNVIEEMNLFLLEHQTGGNGVDGGISPALVEETTVLVENVEEVRVGLRAEPVEVTNLKVGPKVASVVRLATVVRQELHRVVLFNMLGVVLDKLLGAVPKCRDGLNVFVQAKNETVLLLVLNHEAERIVVDVAVKINGGLDAPVVVVVEHVLLVEEEARLEAAHVAVADGVAIDDLALGHVLAHLLGLFLVNPFGE